MTKILAYKPVLMDVDNVTFHSLDHPEWVWPLTKIVRFTCREGHKQIDEECGCGIRVSVNSKEIEKLINRATDPSFPVVVSIVQVLDDFILDTRTREGRAAAIYLWGFIRPKWVDQERFAHLLLYMASKSMDAAFEQGHRNFSRPAYYRSVQEAYTQALKPAWKEFYQLRGR